MVGVQSEACAPVVAAFTAGADEVQGWKKPCKTVSSGISDPLIGYPQDGTLTLRTIRASGGFALSVGDFDTLEAARALSEKEGVFAEPTAATTLAALEKMLKKKLISPKEKIVLAITGHGLKTPEDVKKIGQEAIVVRKASDLLAL